MKALIVANIVGFILMFEQHDIDILQAQGYEVHCATNTSKTNRSDLVTKLKERGVIFHQLDFCRNPLRIENCRAYHQLVSLMRKEKFDLVHCHTPVGSVLTRVAAEKAKTHPVLYSAHGFQFYKGSPIFNWLLYFPIEWICSFLTDVLITINHEDYELAKRHLHAKKTIYVPGVGIDVQRFQNTVVDKTEKRKEIGVPEACVLLLSVGELNRNKNHETVIRALAKIPQTDVHYAIAGKGALDKHLATVAEKLGIADRVHILGHRSDVAELYKAADVFVHPSFREGLPVALMEAMASGLPCVVSKIRGNVDLIDESGETVFSPYSIEECKAAILGHLSMDMQILGQVNAERIKAYNVEHVREVMVSIYAEG